MIRIGKIFLALALGALILSLIDVRSSLELLRTVRLDFLTLFIFIAAPMIWVSCMRWRLFLPEKTSVIYLMRLYVVSYFANLFLPSTIGGDISRSLSLGGNIQNQSRAAFSVLSDRIIGLFALICMSIYSAVYLVFPEVKALGLIAAILLFVLISCYFKAVLSLGILILKKIPKIQNLSFLSKLDRVATEPSLNPRVISFALLWSLAFYLLAVLNVYLAVRCMGDVALFPLLIAVPLALLIAAFPITPGNLGIQEGALIYFLVQVGVSSPLALSVALLLRLKVLFLAGVGGLLLLFKGNYHRDTEPQRF